MNTRWAAAAALGAIVMGTAAPATATPQRSIVRVKVGLDGLTKVTALCSVVGCQVGPSLDTLPGEIAPSSLFVDNGLPDNLTPFFLSLLGIEAVEIDLPVKVADHEGYNDGSSAWGADQATAGVLDQLWDQTPVSYHGAMAWDSYLQQPAASIIRVRDTQCLLGQTGAGTVAIIDTGVDRNHPTLQPFLTLGYDFTRNANGGEERSDVDQATAGVLDGIYGLNQLTAAALDQATAGVLDDTDYSHFGHGTMVAGAVHLVAPTASLMPLKAFAANGEGYTSDILRAVTFAIRNGAKVINMSFSRPTPSNELKRAVDRARSQGILVVASAGNEGQSSPRYPASHPGVISVASTANDDTRSSFSNYGSTIFVAAPGEAVITTYPWGTFAAAWGTSFSTPLVAGAAALLVGMQGTATPAEVSSAIAHAVYLSPDLGNGRLDLYQTVEAGRALWPDAPTSADACNAWAPPPPDDPPPPPPDPPQDPPQDPPPSP
jgi:subtilisin family serine protease